MADRTVSLGPSSWRKDGEEEQGRRGRGSEEREDGAGAGGEGYIDSGSPLVLSRFPVSGRPSQNVVL